MTKDFSLNSTPANEQRRPKNARPDEWIIQFLREAQIGRIASLWDDQPFITPTNFWFDEANHAIAFHSNITGRVRANLERHPRLCFETDRMGQFLPSNSALEFTVQYASVVVFGIARIVTQADEQRRLLTELIAKYFPGMNPGKEYRPITDQELARTSVYSIAIESWSGKENWPEQAKQIDDWPLLLVP